MANSNNDQIMSKRERFAGMAMQGLLAANALYDGKSDARDRLADDAVAHADALIEALNEVPITANPDLLSALKEATLALDGLAKGEGVFKPIEQTIVLAKAAIAKATGSQA